MTEAQRWLHDFIRAPQFLARYPYYAAVLARLEVIADPGVKQMAVSLHARRFYLHVNADYFIANPEYLSGILLHEVHHMVLGHLTHPKFDDVTDRDAMELAMEISANEYIEEPLPNPFLWKAFEPFGLRAGQSTMERYEKILAMRQAKKSPGLTDQKDVDDHSPWRDAERTPGALQQTKQLLNDALESAQQDIRALDPEVMPRFRLAGKEPGNIVEQLVGASGPPVIAMDWKTALQMFVVRARAPVHTYSRPNRRFPSKVGVIPGRSYSPRVITRPSVLIAIDTSMSMTNSELAEIARQLTEMQRYARLTIAECDTEIHRVYPFDGAILDFGGRGGTDLRPIFQPDFIQSQRPDGIVYFTDGEGPTPDKQPSLPVLWVLTKGTEFECQWGQRTRMMRAETASPPKKVPSKKKRGTET